MPETKFERVIFLMLMVFCMVFSMTVYTISLKCGSLGADVFSAAVREMWLEYVVVFCLVFFAVSRLSAVLAKRLFNPEKDNPFFMILSVQSITVCLVVPLITLFATFVHGGAENWFCRWILLAFQCFPAAFFLQVFFIGPLVRFAFRLLFRRAR
ncbi:hypothetical protein [Treponema sp.]|uniref:hypothetical protein n=1 Tax=Treponema sp. TaxID=166 RepID=UPI003EFBDC01